MAIFLENSYSTNNYDYEVAPSKYEPTIEGALMHVWENNQNFQRIIEAATMAEMADQDYFLNEASVSGLFGKFKAFFKKVIEKIKSIIHKAVMALNSITMKNKDFAKKYGPEVRRKMKPKNLSLNCHLLTLQDLDGKAMTYATVVAADKIFNDLLAKPEFKPLKNPNAEPITTNYSDIVDKYTEMIYSAMGTSLGCGSATSYSDLIEDYKDYVIDDAETIDEDDADKIIVQCIGWVESCDKDVKALKKLEKSCVKSIDNYIKQIERWEKEENKPVFKSSDSTNAQVKASQAYMQGCNTLIRLLQTNSNVITGCLGILVQAFNMRAKESRALAVKWVSGKVEESAVYSPMGASDPFAGVSMI